MITTTILFFIFIPLLSIILLTINLIFAPHNAYQEKKSTFECGFHSFLGQNRTQFSISFFIFALLFLIFDLEILLVYPYSVSAYTNEIYGLITMLIFFLVLTLGFYFEIGKNALTIDSRQILTIVKKISVCHNTIIGGIARFAPAKKFFIFCLKELKLIFIFICIYCLSFFILYFLWSKGLIDIPCPQIFEPIYMNPPNNPLDLFPEYKQINNLQQMLDTKNNLLNIKRDLEIKLAFNKPECYKERVDIIQAEFNRNLITIQQPWRLHPHVALHHQVHYMKNLQFQIENAQKDYLERVQWFHENTRNLSECNIRILAANIRLNQLASSSS